MTVIAAIRESEDSLLIASDSLGTDAVGPARIQLKTRLAKLHRHNSAAIAWGCAGDFQLGEDFAEWLEGHEPPSEWGAFKNSVRTKLAELNGQQRYFVEKSGQEWNNLFGADCLLVGWVDERPDIVEFRQDGRMESHIGPQAPFYAIGTGAQWAIPAYRVLREIPSMTSAQKFWKIMELVCNTDPLSGGDVSVYRVTNKSVEKLDTTAEDN